MTATATPIDSQAIHRALQRKRFSVMSRSEIDDERRHRASHVALLLSDMEAGDHSDGDINQLRGGLQYEMLHIRDLDDEACRRDRAATHGYLDAQDEPLADREARFDAAKMIDCADVMRALTGEWGRTSRDRTYFRCPLPDHDDTSPSLVTYPAGRGWHCFGCGAGGDAVALVSAVNAIGMNEALLLLESGALGVGGGF